LPRNVRLQANSPSQGSQWLPSRPHSSDEKNPMKTALLLLTSLFAFQNPQSPGRIEVTRTDGETMTGTLLSLKDGKAKLQVSILGGTMVVTHPVSDFEPASILRMELTANPPSGYDAHFAMAKRAADLGLRTRAGDQARAAVAAAKGAADFEQKQKAVRAWAADALEMMVRDAVAAGQHAEARRCLELLTTRMTDQRNEEQLDAIAASVEGLETKQREDQAAKRQAKLDAQQREKVDGKLKPILANVEKGNKAYGQGVRKNTTVASTKLCEEAVEHFKKAYHALNTLVEKNPDDEHLAAAAASIGKEIHDNGIRAALHAANMLCTQSDFKKAAEWTQKVINFDPDNEEAKEMARVVAAAAADAGEEWRWGWTIGDIGRVGVGPTPHGRNR
jgi:tetratricopeptide (TPR) repeat protein